MMPLSRESRDIIDSAAATFAPNDEAELFERVRIGLGHDGRPRPDVAPFQFPPIDAVPTDDTVPFAQDGAAYLYRPLNRLYVRSGGVWMYVQLL